MPWRGLLHLFYDSIFALSTCFLNFSCSFVRRNGNSVAHLIARWDTILVNEKIYMDPFPQGLQTLAELDL